MSQRYAMVIDSNGSLDEHLTFDHNGQPWALRNDSDGYHKLRSATDDERARGAEFAIVETH